MSILVDIPEINGCIAAGVSAGVELRLEQAKRLEVDLKSTIKATINATVLRLVTKLHAENVPAADGQLLCSAAIVLLSTGNICRDGNTPDGDWVQAVGEAPVTLVQGASVYFANAATEEALRIAASLIVATKVNYFKENHHTGQRGQDGGHYVQKVIMLHFANSPVDHMLGLAYQIGHWASTRSILTQLGVVGLKASVPILGVSAANRIAPAPDVVMRITSTPAGTARHSIAHEIFRKMIVHPIAVFCPSIGDYHGLSETVARIRADPAAYHIGHNYLTDNQPIAGWSDATALGLLGRVGSFGHHFMNTTTVMGSPAVKNDAYKNCPDYDPAFDSLMGSYKLAQLNSQKQGLESLCRSQTVDAGSYRSVCESFGKRPNETLLKAIEESSPEALDAKKLLEDERRAAISTKQRLDEIKAMADAAKPGPSSRVE